MLPRKSLLGLLIGVSDPEAYAMLLAYGKFHRMHAVCLLYAPYSGAPNRGIQEHTVCLRD